MTQRPLTADELIVAHAERMRTATTPVRFLGRYIQNHVMSGCGEAPDLETVAPVYLELAHTLATDEKKRVEFLRVLELAI